MQFRGQEAAWGLPGGGGNLIQGPRARQRHGEREGGRRDGWAMRMVDRWDTWVMGGWMETGHFWLLQSFVISQTHTDTLKHTH